MTESLPEIALTEGEIDQILRGASAMPSASFPSRINENAAPACSHVGLHVPQLPLPLDLRRSGSPVTHAPEPWQKHPDAPAPLLAMP
jgi:hypothetical protein